MRKLLCVMVLVSLVACGDRGGAGSETFLTAEVTKADLPIEVELRGSFVADLKDEIRMEPEKYRGELIVTSLVPEGRAVEKGEVLMEFDPSSLQDAIDDAGDDVKAKEVALAKAQSDLKSWEIDQERKAARRGLDVSKAKAELAKAQALTQGVLDDKKKEVTDAERRLRDAKVDLEQLEQLYEERELHTSTENILIERERRKIPEAERSLVKRKRDFGLWEKYDREWETREKEIAVADKEAEVSKASIAAAAEKKEKENAVAKADRALKKAREKVAALEKDAKTLRVVAPRDGIVFYGAMAGGGMSDVIVFGLGSGNDELKVGGRVKTFQVLMTVASMEKLSIKMKAKESDIQHLKPGLPIVIRPDAFPALMIEGELVKVDQVASRTGFLSDIREFSVQGRYEGSFPQLRSGMNCRVTVRADSVPDCLQVPVLAVFSEGESHYCWVRKGDDRKKRLVKIGASNGSLVEITEGLRPGETVEIYDPAQL